MLSFRRHHLRNFLLAHGKCVKLIRENAKTPPKIGIAMASTTYIPDSETPEGLADAAKKSFETQVGEGSNSLYMDPIALGKASPMMKRYLSAEDLKIISEPMDFVGVNVYQPSNGMLNKKTYEAEEHPKTSLGWVVDGRCLYWTVRQYWERYHLPVMVTENGMAASGVLLSPRSPAARSPRPRRAGSAPMARSRAAGRRQRTEPTLKLRSPPTPRRRSRCPTGRRKR